VQAFKTTEARFYREKQTDLGPGFYPLKNLWKHGPRNGGKFSTIQSTFRSKTERCMSQLIETESKRRQPTIGYYREIRNLATPLMTGGSPNNFTLTGTKKTPAFGS
jgi:hypothetical protein